MGYIEDGKTLFDRARDAAKKVVESLRPGDSASVVLAGRRADGPREVFARPTTRLDDVLQALDAAKPADLSADLTEAIPVAEAQARSAPADAKEVYVFSDLQETSWPDRPLPAESGGPALFVVQVRPQKPVSNLGVTAVQFTLGSADGGCSVHDPPVAHYCRRGPRRRETCGCSWTVKRSASRRWKSCRPAVGPRRVSITLSQRAAGIPATSRSKTRRCRPTIAVISAVEVLQSVKVLAVDGGPSKVGREDALFFLQRA